MRRGAFPGSFDPPTVGHLAIAEAARDLHRLDRVDLVVSRRALEKEDVTTPTLDDRIAVLRRVARRVGWLAVRLTDHQLVVDIAEGYDVVIMGADKWRQVHDVAYYRSPAERDAALARLPPVAVAARPPDEVPPHLALPVRWPDTTDGPSGVSSTLARAGRRELMLFEAAAFDEATGAWTDPERYRRGRQ